MKRGANKEARSPAGQSTSLPPSAGHVHSSLQPLFTCLSTKNDNRGKFHTRISSQVVPSVSKGRVVPATGFSGIAGSGPQDGKEPDKSFQCGQWLKEFASHLIYSPQTTGPKYSFVRGSSTVGTIRFPLKECLILPTGRNFIQI